jgi:hypothetical protein
MKYFRAIQALHPNLVGYAIEDDSTADLAISTLSNWPAGIPVPTAAEISVKYDRMILAESAQIALDQITGARGTLARCAAAGIAFPPEWIAHVASLRLIANGTDTASTVLPKTPLYPAGT